MDLSYARCLMVASLLSVACLTLISEAVVTSSDGMTSPSLESFGKPTTPTDIKNNTSLIQSHEDSNSTISESHNVNDTNNVTFHYEPNEFLVDRNSQNVANESTTQTKELKHAIGSVRNGRMLDLDALIGDVSASRANRMQASTGNRQSRFLPSNDDLNRLNLGKGRRLHIQGFIPIVGMRDANPDDFNQNVNDLLSQQSSPVSTNGKSIITYGDANIMSSPYGQSSLGHASLGVQRYLDTGTVNKDQQVEAKYSMVDSLKKPLRRLASTFTSGSPLESIQRQSNCVCIPFYMCKNGYVSESSLVNKATTVQQQQQARYGLSSQSGYPDIKHSMDESQSSFIANPEPFVQVDERSNDQLTTMNPIESDGSSHKLPTGEQLSNKNSPYKATDLVTQSPEELPAENSTSGMPTAQVNQDVVGRMLSLKGPVRSQTNPQSAGFCGILRTCCTVIPSNQQRISFVEAPTQSSTASGTAIQQMPMSLMANQMNRMTGPYTQQIMGTADPKYSQISSSNLRVPQTVYGMPSQGVMQTNQQPQSPRQQPNFLGQPLNSLALRPDGGLMHRTSTIYQSPTTNRFPLAQLSRGPSQQHPLDSFHVQQLQQSQGLRPNILSSQSTTSSQPNSFAVQHSSQAQGYVAGLGTRKLLEGRCGIQQASGITGRVQNLQYHESSADFGEYPAQAAILKRLPGSDSLFVCAGTLISQYWIATAAHCISKHQQSDLKVRLGEWDVHRDDEFYGHVEKDIRDVIIHPEFQPTNLANDLALLRLDSPVDSTLPHVNPACLPTIDEHFARQRCWVTGWGKDSFGQKGSFQSVLREVELPVVSRTDCEAALRQTRLGPHYRLHQGFICAGGESGRDACEGDGGSGLYCLQDGLIKVAGLVSWGIGCGQAGVPGVYVSLANYRPWIENIISIDEDIYVSAIPRNNPDNATISGNQ